MSHLSRNRTLLAAAYVAASMVACPLHAQVGIPPSDAPTQGWWEAYHDLQGTGIREIDPNMYGEIVHAAVVPPHKDQLDHPSVGHVLFWCYRKPGVPGAAIVYEWNIRFPQGVVKRTINATGLDSDPFCSGHVWLPDGDFLIGGGNNYLLGSPPFGHPHLMRLSYSTGSAVWTTSITPGGLSPMIDIRWYPTALQLADERTIFLGSNGNFTASINPTRVRDVFDYRWPLGTTIPHIRNIQRDVPGHLCLDTDSRLETYPHIFALRNGLAFKAGQAGNGEFWDVENRYGTFLNPPHPNCPPITDRWLQGGAQPEPVADAHLDGGAIHLITRLPASPVPGLPTLDPLGHGYLETIYQLGGSEHYEPLGQGVCCGCGLGSVHDDMIGIVERVHNPTPDVALAFGPPTFAWDGSPPDLLEPRGDLVAVVLLDGSILVLGGERMDPVGCDNTTGPSCTCIALYTPERYLPPEVFGTSASTQWVKMNAHAFAHRYHCVAGMLPTGQVFLAGGKYGSGSPQTSDKIVEIYSPPYVFNGPRPMIDRTTLYAVSSGAGPDRAIS